MNRSQVEEMFETANTEIMRIYKERKTMIRKWTVDGMRNARHARNS